ncbi:phage portal protein [Kaistia adipata]|uniref:phage portal protein n=1 Tax=Kaistia adipata TaxID=166954 RepID=UPI000424966B|nr:phage portal protein [Kaistia adipata]
MTRANFIDRAVGWIAPQAGLRRIRHRAAMDVLTRDYAGADRGRLKASIRAPSTSADAEVSKASRLLRDRMRDLVRNNPHAANALSVLVTHAVGDGIVPRTKDPKVNALFAAWSKRCDADGLLDFAGIQSLAVRGMFESGDGLVRRRRRRVEDGLPVPLQLQVLETDLIDSSKDGIQSGGGVVIQGIEFDAIRKRRAYWMFGAHPGNSFFDPLLSIKSNPVPAEDIAHVYERQRPQVRGIPWGSPVIADLYDLASYEQAELVRKKLEACLVGVVTGGDINDPIGMEMSGADGQPLPAGVYNARGARVEKFEPGMFYNAVGGKDIKFSQPAATGSYDAYKTSMLHTIAAGFRVPHALLSGRLDKINYSSSKVGIEVFNRMISALQWQVIIPMLCEPIWRWFLEAAYFAGLIDHMNHEAEWSPPRPYSADPGRDVNAKLAEVRAGFKSLSAAIAETGYNPDDVLAQIAEDNKKLDKLGIILDSDPRRISQAGQVQQQIDDKADSEDTP